jgi:hypothetical protein
MRLHQASELLRGFASDGYRHSGTHQALEKKAGLAFADSFALRGKPDETAEEVRARYLAESGTESLDGLDVLFITRPIVEP